MSFEFHPWYGVTIDAVSVMIGVIGILVPLLFCLFTLHVLRRDQPHDKALSAALADFLREANMRHAEAEIAARSAGPDNR